MPPFALDLPGPSRRIRVEPLPQRLPEEPAPAPPPRREPERRPAPDREPEPREPVPA